MSRRFQFAPSAGRVLLSVRRVLFGLLPAAVLLLPLGARAQDSPFGAIGRVEGNDISCENGTPQTGGTSSVGPSLEVMNGTVVTVHSGQAVMTLFAGGEVGICGPAKLTVLLSGGAVTLALNFGRVRLALPAKTALRIFTPTIVGTPIDISGGARDVTVGLNLDDSLCVLATSGAIQLEHQFTSERLIVPQGGEFFLNAGRLLPVAGTPGSCHCSAGEAAPQPIPKVTPEYALNVSHPTVLAPASAKAPAPAPSPVPVPDPSSALAIVAVTIPALVPPTLSAPAPPPDFSEPTPEPAVRPNIEVSVLAEANEIHPIVPPAKNSVPAPPPTSEPVYTAVLPPLTFMAGSPTRLPDPAPDVVLLIREAKVSPEWEFTGHVAAPEFAQAMQQALGEKAPAAGTQPQAENQPPAKPAKKKGGFWASLKRAFGGGST
jgi:hypothetical protein